MRIQRLDDGKTHKNHTFCSQNAAHKSAWVNIVNVIVRPFFIPWILIVPKLVFRVADDYRLFDRFRCEAPKSAGFSMTPLWICGLWVLLAKRHDAKANILYWFNMQAWKHETSWPHDVFFKEAMFEYVVKHAQTKTVVVGAGCMARLSESTLKWFLKYFLGNVHSDHTPTPA